MNRRRVCLTVSIPILTAIAVVVLTCLMTMVKQDRSERRLAPSTSASSASVLDGSDTRSWSAKALPAGVPGAVPSTNSARTQDKPKAPPGGWRLYTDEQIAQMSLQEVQAAMAQVHTLRVRAYRQDGPSSLRDYENVHARLRDHFEVMKYRAAGGRPVLYSDEEIRGMSLADAQEALIDVAHQRSLPTSDVTKAERFKVEFDLLLKRIRQMKEERPRWMDE